MTVVEIPRKIEAGSNSQRRVRLGSPVYNLLLEFLIDEATLLDGYQFNAWLELMAPEILYTAPVRVTKRVSQSEGSVDPSTRFFHDDYETLKLRVRRLEDTPSAWAEDPRSRTRRFVTNVTAWETEKPNEYAVRSYLLLARNRSDLPTYHWITAERNDVVKIGGDDQVKLVRREIILDASVLGVPNLALFL